MDTQRHKPLTPRKSQALSSLDNHYDLLNQRNLSHQSSLQDENGFSYKSLQPIKPVTTPVMTNDDKVQKENRPPVLTQRIQTPPSASHSHAGYSSYTGTTNINDTHIRRSAPLKLESSRPRPTTGGKTISASLMDRVNRSYHDAGDHQRGDHSDTSHHRARARPRTEQRMSQEQLKLLSRRIDTSLPNSPHGSPSKPLLPSIFSNGSSCDKPKPSSASSPCRLSSFSSSLYQTCIDLWPSEPTLGDFASENIKNLTDLLKVRLSQAKYRILAQLEDEERQTSQGMACKKMYPAISSAAGVLRDDIDYSTWPTFEKHPIELSPKRSRGFSCVSGNGSGLFRHRDAYLQRQRITQQHKRQQQKHQHIQRLQQIKHLQGPAPSTMMNHGSAVSLPPPALNNLKKDMKRKRRTKPKTEIKSPPRDDGRVQASLVSPVVTEDGTRAYVCTPCSKKYKTRNGLAYHFNRCPQQPKQVSTHMAATAASPMEDEAQVEQAIMDKYQPENNHVYNQCSPTGSKSSGVQCVCDHPTDDEKMMVQCDECQLWLHLDCVGTNDAILDDIYHCPRCTDRLTKRPRLDQQPDDMANLIFQQLNDNTPTTSITYPLQPANMDHHTPSQPSVSSSSQQQPIWEDFDLVKTTPSTVTVEATPPATARMPVTTASAASNTSTTNDVNNNNNNLWGMSTADIPSLLYSDATVMTSTLDDDLPYLMDLPSSELSPHDLPPTDWFQFANFDDDFHCDDSQATTQ